MVRFDWEVRGKFPTLTEPYDGFHDLVFAEEFGPQAFITRARKEGMRDFGACMAPMTAFQILQGLETLPLRMARHVENTETVVAFLSRPSGGRSSATRGSPTIRTTRSQRRSCRKARAPCSASK